MSCYSFVTKCIQFFYLKILHTPQQQIEKHLLEIFATVLKINKNITCLQVFRAFAIALKLELWCILLLLIICQLFLQLYCSPSLVHWVQLVWEQFSVPLDEVKEVVQSVVRATQMVENWRMDGRKCCLANFA